MKLYLQQLAPRNRQQYSHLPLHNPGSNPGSNSRRYSSNSLQYSNRLKMRGNPPHKLSSPGSNLPPLRLHLYSSNRPNKLCSSLQRNSNPRHSNPRHSKLYLLRVSSLLQSSKLQLTGPLHLPPTQLHPRQPDRSPLSLVLPRHG